jgi:hypothetical protein
MIHGKSAVTIVAHLLDLFRGELRGLCSPKRRCLPRFGGTAFLNARSNSVYYAQAVRCLGAKTRIGERTLGPHSP